MKINYSLFAYAMDFASFLLWKLGDDAGKIKGIILFGSVARGESKKESDVDIFVDLFRDEKKTADYIKRLADDFRDSVKFTKFWKLLGINNEIVPMVGVLSKWEDLHASIITNGIVLYGSYQEVPNPKSVVLLWGNIKPPVKRVMLSKHIFGYTHYGKKYGGLLEKFGGSKLGKGAIEIPLESYPSFMKVFRSYKIPVKIKYAIS